jgi:hypothetical protein
MAAFRGYLTTLSGYRKYLASVAAVTSPEKELEALCQK